MNGPTAGFPFAATRLVTHRNLKNNRPGEPEYRKALLIKAHACITAVKNFFNIEGRDSMAHVNHTNNATPPGGAPKADGPGETITAQDYENLDETEKQNWVEDPVGSGKYRKKTDAD
jgi:hypothetical protein